MKTYKVVKVYREKYETKGVLLAALDGVAMILPWDTGHEELRSLTELEFTGEQYEDELS